MKNSYLSILALCGLIAVKSSAKENVGMQKTKIANKTNSGCTAPVAKADLDIGNVRATILSGGDMWWDLLSAKYEVPKTTNATAKRYSIFAGSLWIGGIDAASQLRLAAGTYRQTGMDFSTGPLDTLNVTISNADCYKFDQIWKVNRADVLAFKNGGAPNSVITTWPGNGTGNQSHYLAPFYDANADGIYDPSAGDYPGYSFAQGSSNCNNNTLQGDQTLWWVFNDIGNIHTESRGAPLGIEIQAQAFAFASTNTDISNTTFYKYKIINRSSIKIDSTFIGQWVDPDLGYAFDDYVGCDVTRGMGYCYNGNDNDNGPTGYGTNPPAIGIDFLQGPFADIGDGKDNDRDGCVDCTFKDSLGVRKAIPDTKLREEIIMSKFTYYDNSATVQGNPAAAKDYYNYMNGVWRDNVRFTYGGNAKGGGNGATGNQCDFMFPGDSDPNGFGTGGTPTNPKPRALWTETTAGNTPGDRRFLMSAGPFTLLPGAVNYITTAVVWARATSGGAAGSVAALKAADDVVQGLFSTCFQFVPVGIKELNNSDLTAKVYPNPFSTFATITFENKANETFQLMVFDISGRLVKTVSGIKTDSVILEKENMNAGMYTYKLASANHSLNGKIVIE
jgi:hypothetical protein